jgi:hypothetical protein
MIVDLIAVLAMFLGAVMLVAWAVRKDRGQEEGPTESLHSAWPDDPTELIIDDYGRHVTQHRSWPVDEGYCGRHRRGVWFE